MPSQKKLPKAGGRIFYVIRHAEREDNINQNWQKLHPDKKFDNSPLSARGKVQAEELGKR